MTSTEKRPTRLHLRITPTAEWKLRSGHPWLYAESILEQNRPGQLGELAVIYDRHDNFLAIGLFDPDSPLRVRVLVAGKAQPIDAAWWRSHFTAAIHRRDELFDAQTTGYRLLNGESDGCPGLVLDRYDTTLVLKLYTGAWLPWLGEILPVLMEESPSPSTELRFGAVEQPMTNTSKGSSAPQEVASGEVHRLVLRLSRNIQATAQQFGSSDGQIVSGPALEHPVVFLEAGLRLEADVLRGQKTGFFLDQRENRRLVESLAKGRAVLNAFSFSGGFSLYAARGGAQAVTDLDISAHALEAARRNFALNQSDSGVARCRHETIQADAFEWIKNQERPAFDLIVLDPPSLAKREVERTRAIQAYGQLARQALGCLRAGGILVAASCSAHVSAMEFFDIIRTMARESGRRFKELETSGHPPDHPATFPEARYLKCIFLKF